jgi:hypothetical protein
VKKIIFTPDNVYPPRTTLQERVDKRYAMEVAELVSELRQIERLTWVEGKNSKAHIRCKVNRLIDKIERG